ncbi:MAG TPA: hypothetical protein VE131_16905, partial [Terriglobales bacterium]|nr:hypothetical protein [Terriglobales bacterium]
MPTFVRRLLKRFLVLGLIPLSLVACGMASTGAVQPPPETSAVPSTEAGLASITPTAYLPRPTSTRTPLPTASPTATLTP